jgi:hypothetical protein
MAICGKRFAMERVEIGDAVLLRGNASDLLPSFRHLDAVLTEPAWPGRPGAPVPAGRNPRLLWRRTVAALPDLHRLIVVLRRDSDPRYLAAVPENLPFFCAITLPGQIPAGTGRVLGCDGLAYWFGSPVANTPGRRFVPGRSPPAQQSVRPRNGEPWRPDQAHTDWLVEWCADPGETVCDPFMGTGATGVACAKLGRPFVGIEPDKRCFDLACERIEEAGRQADLVARLSARQPGAFPRLL